MRRAPKIRTHRVDRVERNPRSNPDWDHMNFPDRLQMTLDDMSAHGYRIDEIKIGNHDAIIVGSREEPVHEG